MMQRTRKAAARSRPMLEPLESRQLLNARTRLAKTGQPINDKDLARLILQLQNNVPVAERRIAYELADGTSVVVTLYGKGTLKGTTVLPDGSLDLVFNNTDNLSRIVGAVRGPHGRHALVPLASVRDADSPVGSTSADGVNPLAALQLPNFRLVEDGQVNLMGGILELNLREAGRNTAFYLKEGTPVEVAGTGTTTILEGGASVGGVTNVTAINLPTRVDVSGTTGLQVRIDRINAGPLGTPALKPAQIYAVDPSAADPRLIRFDTRSGQPLDSVALPALATTTPPVGLAYTPTQTLVLVGNETEVLAYNLALDFVGKFDTTNLAGFTNLIGIGANTISTVITSKNGPGYSVDVAASLSAGQAVSVGAPIVPQREFIFNGDATGLAGLNSIFADGAGHFDTAQPNLFQFGTLTLTQVQSLFRESARAAVPGLISPFENAGATGLDQNPFRGLGSVSGRLARLTRFDPVNGVNFVTLYNTQNVTQSGSIQLKYDKPLYGLSESVHTELAGASIIDVDGNMKRFVGKQIRGLIVNVRGGVNLVAIHTARDSAFVGRPLNHVEFVTTENVQLISSARGVNGMVRRGNVTINKNLPSYGQILLP